MCLCCSPPRGAERLYLPLVSSSARAVTVCSRRPLPSAPQIRPPYPRRRAGRRRRGGSACSSASSPTRPRAPRRSLPDRIRSAAQSSQGKAAHPASPAGKAAHPACKQAKQPTRQNSPPCQAKKPFSAVHGPGSAGTALPDSPGTRSPPDPTVTARQQAGQPSRRRREFLRSSKAALLAAGRARPCGHSRASQTHPSQPAARAGPCTGCPPLRYIHSLHNSDRTGESVATVTRRPPRRRLGGCPRGGGHGPPLSAASGP